MKNTVYVVGGGASLKDFPWGKLFNKDVIAVNMSIFNVPTAKYFITMDYTFLRKSKIQCSGKLSYGPKHYYFKDLPTTKIFLMAIPEDKRIKVSEKIYIDKAYNLTYNLQIFDKVVEVGGYGGLGKDMNDFRSGSDSGFAGLQLAALLGYKKIYLLGFDFYAEQKTHFHTEYGNTTNSEFQDKLIEYLRVYPKAILEMKQAGIQVTSCSKFSKLNSYIPYLPWGEIL
jgi:hypothetical protein